MPTVGLPAAVLVALRIKLSQRTVVAAKNRKLEIHRLSSHGALTSILQWHLRHRVSFWGLSSLLEHYAQGLRGRRSSGRSGGPVDAACTVSTLPPE